MKKEMALREWALSQLPQLDEYITFLIEGNKEEEEEKPKGKRGKKRKLTPDEQLFLSNPLIRADSLPGLWLLGIHLGLYGWSDGEEELEQLLDQLDEDSSFRDVLEAWGVEPSSVIGGLECRLKGKTDTKLPYDPLPPGYESRVFDIVGQMEVRFLIPTKVL